MKNIVLVITVLCYSFCSWAHSPTEIGYEFDEKKNSLVVHTTHQSLKDLIAITDPHTKQMSKLDFNLYLKSIEDYFNDELSICINGEGVVLHIMETDFSGHDVTLDFELLIEKEEWSEFEIEVLAFTEIYRKTKNIVTLKSQNFYDVFVLRKSNTAAEFRA